MLTLTELELFGLGQIDLASLLRPGSLRVGAGNDNRVVKWVASRLGPCQPYQLHIQQYQLCQSLYHIFFLFFLFFLLFIVIFVNIIVFIFAIFAIFSITAMTYDFVFHTT
jgi:hypothetical protein